MKKIFALAKNAKKLNFIPYVKSYPNYKSSGQAFILL